MADLRTEALYSSLLHIKGPPTADPVPGTWTFVPNVDHVHAELLVDHYEYVAISQVKDILRFNQKQYIRVALGQCGETVLYGYITRRYAQPCDDPNHMCADKFVITVETFLPAVINSSMSHIIDPAVIMKIDLDTFAARNLFVARMCICDYIVRLPLHATAESVYSTPITWDPLIFSREDMRFPQSEIGNLERYQIVQSLQQINLGQLFCSEELTVDQELYDTIGATPSADYIVASPLSITDVVDSYTDSTALDFFGFLSTEVDDDDLCGLLDAQPAPSLQTPSSQTPSSQTPSLSLLPPLASQQASAAEPKKAFRRRWAKRFYVRIG